MIAVDRRHDIGPLHVVEWIDGGGWTLFTDGNEPIAEGKGSGATARAAWLAAADDYAASILRAVAKLREQARQPRAKVKVRK